MIAVSKTADEGILGLLHIVQVARFLDTRGIFRIVPASQLCVLLGKSLGTKATFTSESNYLSIMTPSAFVTFSAIPTHVVLANARIKHSKPNLKLKLVRRLGSELKGRACIEKGTLTE